MSRLTSRFAPLLLALVLALAAALVVLAPSIQLSEGTPFSLSAPRMMMGGAPEMGDGTLLMAVMRAVLALMIVGVPIYIIVSLLTKEGRRRLIGHILAVVLLALLLQALQSLSPQMPEGQRQLPQEAQPEGPTAQTTPPPEAKYEERTSEDAVTTATILIALLLALGALGVIAAMTRRKPPPTTLDDIADDAQRAIDALDAGDELEETIQRCYRGMCDVVQRERQIQRAAAVTPHEFEESLAQAGLPRTAVHTLTGLFERIRYGNQPAGAAEQTAAREALSAIVAACDAGARRRT